MISSLMMCTGEVRAKAKASTTNRLTPPIALAETQPLFGTLIFVRNCSVSSSLFGTHVCTTSPLTITSTKSTGAIEASSTFILNESGSCAVKAISSPGDRPSTSRKRRGPFVAKVLPALTALIQDSKRRGPFI